MKLPIAQRFWLHLDRTVVKRPDLGPCWEWQLGRNKDGYGRVSLGSGSRRTGNRRHLQAHRLSWELSNGDVPEGLNVLHRCDNPPCCNPTHLFLGTQKENMQDKVAKGRHGSRPGMRHRRLKEPSNAVRLTVGDETATLAEWSARTGVRTHAIWVRIHKLGWSAERAVSTPVRSYRRSV